MTWKKLFKKVRPSWPLSIFGKKKLLLAFEFGIVLSDVAKDLNIEMTREIVLRAEKLLENEMRHSTASDFACKMNVYTLAVLEPKDI